MLARKPWTTLEIEAIVADYIEMLEAELRGKRYVKSHHNKALRKLIGRSKGSIEYKHQNISAVLEVLGLPHIRGYRPARNYQRALFEAIEDRLTHRDGKLTRITSALPAKPPGQGSGIIYQAPPPPLEPSLFSDPEIRRIVRNHDPAERDARARELGQAGEEFLYRAEQNRLSEVGRDDLANQVRWVSMEYGDGVGYDILSFSDLGEKRLLEVKTTNGPAKTPFWLSRNELRVSEERRDAYRLLRLYHFSSQPEAFRLTPPLNHQVTLTPTQYRATF